MKSLRKVKKERKSKDKLSLNHLHLVAGKHQHSVTHSVTPISADEIEKLEKINPEYGKRLFNLLEKSLEIEHKELDLYYNAIEKEQENDELTILSQSELNKKSLIFAGTIIVFMIFSSLLFAYLGHEIIAGAIISTGLVGIIKAILKK